MELTAILKIIHLSDLHFGTHNNDIVENLEREIKNLAPDIVIISGDFTQIGSAEEFAIAADFLKNINRPYLCIPGNHDIPARNLVQRFFDPYKKYRKYIFDDLCPVMDNDHVLIAGLNSARRALPHWNWANGAISKDQRERLKTIFKANEPRWKICTFHHPIHKVDDMPLDVTVFGRKRTLQTIQDLKIDLVLTGHVHHASITMRGDETHQSVYLSASTALSSRTRGQENGFNLITLEHNQMRIDVYKLGANGFAKAQKFEMKKF